MAMTMVQDSTENCCLPSENTQITLSTFTIYSEIMGWSWHRGCLPPCSSLSLKKVDIPVTIWLCPSFHLWCKRTMSLFQFLYPGTTLPRSKNYHKMPRALIKALANFSILVQILFPKSTSNSRINKQTNEQQQKQQISWGTVTAIFRAENICKFLHRSAIKIFRQDIFPWAVLPQSLVVLYWLFLVLSSPEDWSSPWWIAEKNRWALSVFRWK